jgi:hypothetical protein
VQPPVIRSLAVKDRPEKRANQRGGNKTEVLDPVKQRVARSVLKFNRLPGEKTVNIVGSPCAPSSSAQAYVFNATVVPTGSLGYLTLWPDGENQPVVSTLNAVDGAVTSNMAIVPNLNGKTDAYAANGLTQLILDISSYFAP